MSEKRLRNTATVLIFPLIDYNTGEYYTGTWAGLTNATIEAYHWSDGVAPQALSIAATPEQLGSTGLWQLALTASELNVASQYIIIKFDADELAAQGITIDLVDSLVETIAGQIKAKTDLIPASPATSAQVAACLQTTDPDLATILSKVSALPADPASNTTVNTRLASADYTAPDNASITAIKEKTDNLPDDPASDTLVNTRLASADYTAPDNAGITAIKEKTDNLPDDPASNTTVNTRLASADYTAPDNAGITAIKEKTDNLPASPANESTLSNGINTIRADIAEIDGSGGTGDNSDVLAAIAALNNLSVDDILANQSIKDALTVLIGNHVISGSTLTHSRTGADNVAFTVTSSSKARV